MIATIESPAIPPTQPAECEHKCAGCPYTKSIAIGSRGPIDAEIVIVGEAPGNQELQKGIPFIGPSGQMLERLFNNVGLDLDACFITNSISCRQPKDEKITRDAINACNKRLISEITSYPRKLVIAAGATALRALTGSDMLRIMKSHGQLIENPNGHSFTVFPTIHPAAILRQGSLMPQLESDVKAISDLIHDSRYDRGTTEWIVIEKSHDVQRAMVSLSQCEYLACDIETTNLGLNSPILQIGICWQKNKVLIFPRETIEKYHAQFKQLFENPNIKWTFHNGKFDTARLRIQYGFEVDQTHDTMLMHYALDESPNTHGLKYLAAVELGANEWTSEIDGWLGVRGNAGQKLEKIICNFGVIPRPLIQKYLAHDCDNTLQLLELYLPQLEEDPSLLRMYNTFLIRASNFLRDVEMYGIYVDQERLDQLSLEIQSQISELRREMEQDVWRITKGHIREFNPNSVKQVRQILYAYLRLRPVPEEKENFTRSTNVEDLKRLEDHPFTYKLIRYRKLSKLLGTYLTGVRNRIDSRSRVHTTFKQHQAVTGRLSSTDPNIQNIKNYDPRDEDAVNVKLIFSAPPGRVLINVDYSQAEIRTLAALSKDPYLIDIYVNGRDLHDEVAKKIIGPNYSPYDRRAIKNLNFGIIYGQGAAKFARMWKKPIEEAARHMKEWFALMPKAAAYLERNATFPGLGKPLKSPMGRLRRFGYVTKENEWKVRNEAKNAVIQITASDLTLISAMYTEPQISKYDAHIVNLVHDSLLIECPDDPETIQRVSKIAVSIMEKVPERFLGKTVPFVADIKVGKNWGEMEEEAA